VLNAPPAAALYRASGFVQWHFSDMAAMADDVCCRRYSGSRRSIRFGHRGLARFLSRKSENISLKIVNEGPLLAQSGPSLGVGSPRISSGTVQELLEE
jgi:hypothetical protein